MAMETYTEVMEVPPVGTYTFRIFDEADDGLCCGFGEGAWSLAIATHTVHVGNPSFRSSDYYQFVLPMAPLPPAMPPTMPPLIPSPHPPAAPPTPPSLPYEGFGVSVNVLTDKCVGGDCSNTWRML